LVLPFPKKKTIVSAEILTNTIWVSTFLAMILALPPLGLFIGIYFGIGNLILGVFVGFGVHFITLAFSSKISKFLINIMN
jgi:hypothetical protein